ncbi:MAG: type IV pili twitching motility protein PilT, partial [Candidatus Pacebacteria bacterium]|nr:type IV pili twitching motility protein PilT [Candidatus Paceibacterota bacterium]
MDYQAKLTELLLATARQNASDLHIGVGQPPTLRLDGALIPLTGEQIITPEVAEGLVQALLNDEQKKVFAEKKE